MECCGKSRDTKPDNKKAGEVDVVKILRVKKQIRYTEIGAEIASDHGKKDHPTKHQHMIALQIVKQQLNRERVCYYRDKKIQPSSHGQ